MVLATVLATATVVIQMWQQQLVLLLLRLYSWRAAALQVQQKPLARHPHMQLKHNTGL
jgi:hypothetical protein